MANMAQLFSKRIAYVRAVVWIVLSFAVLAIGVLAGPLAGKGWRWILPVVGFTAYLLAMRRGLRLWNPEGLDLFWLSAPGTKYPDSGRSENTQRPKVSEVGRGGHPRRGPDSPQGDRTWPGPERA